MVDRWTHVALVNDPTSATTTMYVDGAPVLRNATDSAGQACQRGHAVDLRRATGSDKATNGWHGCIGETRIVDHPTDARSG